jgi:hypothetical protein
MDFWRAELLLEIHKEKMEEENRRRKKEEDSTKTPSMGGFLSQQQSAFSNLTKGGLSKFGK